MLIDAKTNGMSRVSYVKISEVEYPVYFGYSTLVEIIERAGLKLNELDRLGEALTLRLTIEAAHLGLHHGGRRAGKPYEADFDDTCDLLDEDPDALNAILEVFARSLPQPEEKKAKAGTKASRLVTT